MHWAKGPRGQTYKPDWIKLCNLSSTCYYDKKLQGLVQQLRDAPCEVDRVLDYRLNGDSFDYLVSWVGYPQSQSTWEPPDIFEDPADATQWWGTPTIEEEEIKRNGDWWLKLRWETQGIKYTPTCTRHPKPAMVHTRYVGR